METILNTSENHLNCLRSSEGTEENTFTNKWSDSLLFGRKSFETGKRENLHAGVLNMSVSQCDKINTEFRFQYETTKWFIYRNETF